MDNIVVCEFLDHEGYTTAVPHLHSWHEFFLRLKSEANRLQRWGPVRITSFQWRIDNSYSSYKETIHVPLPHGYRR